MVVAAVEAEEDGLVGRHIFVDEVDGLALPFVFAAGVGELADDDGLGAGERAALLQREQHAVEVVHPLVDIFDEEDAVFRERVLPRGAQTGNDEAQSIPWFESCSNDMPVCHCR